MKKNTLQGAKWFIAVIFCLCCQISYTQDLTVSVTVTDEVCSGTGALTITVGNADPDVPVNYKVYLEPELEIPIWNSSENYVPSLQQGDYLIVATQVINGNTVTGQQQATINSLYQPVVFTINSESAACSNQSDMVIEVTAGNPFTYEILDGPQTAGPQSSNIFTNLPPGTYQVRVTDECGNGFVSTQTFYTQQAILSVSGPGFPDETLTDCDTINISFVVASQNGANIIYPLTVVYTVYPPGGGTPVVYNQTVNEGAASTVQLAQVIDFYNTSYTIDVEVTDICGTVYELNNSIINQQMSASATAQQVLCGNNALVINVSQHASPFTINFTGAPAGFNPNPGPYNSSSAVFGNDANPVPLGNYNFTVTDACGRTDSGTITIGNPVVPVPAPTAINNDCINELGEVTIAIPNHPLQTATITSAPAGYPETLPYNVTGLIDSDGNLTVEDMPEGNYVFSLTDACGNSYTTVPAAVPGYTFQEPQINVRPDCIPGMGTIRMRFNISAVIITSAPPAFPHPLPYNASFNIQNGQFFMDNLPGGSYTFSITTPCITNFSKTVDIPQLNDTSTDINLANDCNDFGVNINYVSNANQLQFWLQLYDNDIDGWVHPETGEPYVEGTPISEENALQLENGSSNSGFPFTGEFRVIKRQRAFCSASEGCFEKFCEEVVYEFSFYSELSITGIYNLTCIGDIIDIQVNAQGVAPLQYEIISKDGDTDFYIDNGTDNIFSGLDSGLYQVRVTDPCGGFRVQQFNVADLPPIVSATEPGPLAFCDYEGTGVGTFDLSLQNDAILEDVDPNLVTLTYHASVEDAASGSNSLPLTYSSGPAAIYARVVWNVNANCNAITSFDLIITPAPELMMDDVWGICNDETITVTADSGYSTYEWSTGETTQSIVAGPGTYTVTVTSGTNCETSKTIEVLNIVPPTVNIVLQDWTDSNNSITAVTEANSALYEYSIDGLIFQESNTFPGLPPAQYTVYVRDRFGCTSAYQQDVALLTYPKLFTPNGDGINDTWRIPYGVLEPNMTITVFDRYGKLLSSFTANSAGWDGTFNGERLSANDYWFIVRRQNGQEYRGHFSLIR